MKIELINGSIIEIIESDDNVRSKRGNKQIKDIKFNNEMMLNESNKKL